MGSVPDTGRTPVFRRPGDEAVRWAEVSARLGHLTAGERRLLLLLARLPLLSAMMLSGIEGLRSPAPVYRRLARVRRAGLVHALPARLPAGPASTAEWSAHSPELFYLSDTGVAAVALDWGADLSQLVRRNKLARADILGLVPGLPQLTATYRLLASLAIGVSRAAATGTGGESAARGAVDAGATGDADDQRPRLLAWERPWRRRFVPLAAATRISLRASAYAAFRWGTRQGAYLFVPDLATVPIGEYDAMVSRLFDYRTVEEFGGSGHLFPALVVATTDAGRAAAWHVLIGDHRDRRSEAPLRAHVTTWQDLRSDNGWVERCGLWPLPSEAEAAGPNALVRRQRMLPLVPVDPAARIPRLVGSPLVQLQAGTGILQLPMGQRQANPSSTRLRSWLGAAALALTTIDREMLDLLGRHPFLTAPQLGAVLGRPPKWVRSRWRRLEAYSLVRRVTMDEVAPHDAPLLEDEVLELTTAGLAIVAAQQGLTLAEAVRRNGLVGGGPNLPLGQRAALLGTLRHTVGTNGVFAGLLQTVRRRVRDGHDDAVRAWRSAAACISGRLRPDGYGVYWRDGVAFGFFLEYDRGTMKDRDYRRKFATYYAFLDGERYCREYDACPTVLMVTCDGAADARITRAALASSVGRAERLPLLVTRESRVRRQGLLAPIWHEPGSTMHRRPL